MLQNAKTNPIIPPAAPNPDVPRNYELLTTNYEPKYAKRTQKDNARSNRAAPVFNTGLSAGDPPPYNAKQSQSPYRWRLADFPIPKIRETNPIPPWPTAKIRETNPIPSTSSSLLPLASCLSFTKRTQFTPPPPSPRTKYAKRTQFHKANSQSPTPNTQKMRNEPNFRKHQSTEPPYGHGPGAPGSPYNAKQTQSQPRPPIYELRTTNYELLCETNPILTNEN